MVADDLRTTGGADLGVLLPGTLFTCRGPSRCLAAVNTTSNACLTTGGGAWASMVRTLTSSRADLVVLWVTYLDTLIPRLPGNDDLTTGGADLGVLLPG